MSSELPPPPPATWLHSRPEWGRVFLRGIGQVMFQENALTGLLFLIGIAAAAGEEDPRFALLMAFGAVIGTVVGTLTAWVLGYDWGDVRAGIYGFNGTLVGIAMFFYFQPTALAIALLLAGCAASAVVTWAMRSFLPFPTYTFPFIVTTWVLLGIGTLLNLPRVALPPPPSNFNIVTAFTEGLGEVMFQASIITSIAFLAGLAVNNWRHAVLALLGSILGTLVGIYHQDPTGPVTIGIYGYNAALAAIALYLWRPSLVIPILGAFLTTPLTEMFPKIHEYFAGLNPAALTAPFVFACWIVIAIGNLEKFFEPSRNERSETAERGSQCT
jgi:urea transporter